jgi:hypothetical protein
MSRKRSPQLTKEPLTFKLVGKKKLGAHPRSFFMSKPTLKQVEKDGQLLWEVSHGGMVRYFKYDWQANFHYEAAVRLSRTKKTGKSG